MPIPSELYVQLTSQSLGGVAYGNRVSQGLLPFLDQLAADIELRIQEASTDWSKARLQRMLSDVRSLTRSTRDQLMAYVVSEAQVIGGQEALNTQAALQQVTLVPIDSISPEKISTIVSSQAFNGRVMGTWWAGWEQAAFDRMRQQVWLGYAQGESPAQIARRLLGNVDQALLRGRSPGERRYRGIFLSARRNARTIARTAINHAAQASRMAVFEANDDIVEAVEWDATLDHRTCIICGSRDGQVYPLKAGPRPPAHPNCRCQVLPVIDESDLDLPPESRASSEGPVQGLDYEQWVRKRPRVARQLLGKKKAKLFLEGELDLEDFIDDAGFTYNLDQLKALHPEPFRELGL